MPGIRHINFLINEVNDSRYLTITWDKYIKEAHAPHRSSEKHLQAIDKL